MQVRALALAATRTLCVWVVIENIVRMIVYPFYQNLKYPLASDELGAFLHIFFFGLLFFIAPRIMRFIAPEESNIAWDVAVLSTGLRLLGAWFLLSSAGPLVTYFVLALTPKPQIAQMMGVMAFGFGGILMMLFAPAITNLLTSFDIRANLRHQLLRPEMQSPPDYSRPPIPTGNLRDPKDF